MPFFHALQKPNDPSAAEKKFLDEIAAFPQKHGAHALVQGSQPQVAAAGLNDSPVKIAKPSIVADTGTDSHP